MLSLVVCICVTSPLHCDYLPKDLAYVLAVTLFIIEFVVRKLSRLDHNKAHTV